jgi:hypothetical protein
MVSTEHSAHRLTELSQPMAAAWGGRPDVVDANWKGSRCGQSTLGLADGILSGNVSRCRARGLRLRLAHL